MHLHGRRYVGILFSFIIVLVSVALAAVAQEPSPYFSPVIKNGPAPSIHSVGGADLYNAYCAVCHGTDGKGDGPAAIALRSRLPDLTLLAKSTRGKLSRADVETAVTGRGRLIPAHGTEEMPMWGPVFKSVYGDDGALLRLVNLVTYIDSLQVK